MTNTAQDTRFKPGASGNPRGRPTRAASRHKAEVLIEERMPGLIAHALDRAEHDDQVLAGLCQLLAQRLRAQNLIAERRLLDGTTH